jgi:hypothetical protein
VTNRLAVSVHQAGKTGLAHSGGPAAAAKAETSAAAARKKRRSNAPGVVVKLASAIDDTAGEIVLGVYTIEALAEFAVIELSNCL